MKYLFVFILALLCTYAIAEDNMYYISDIYTKSVPHIDKKGNVLTEYDADKSFFSLASWGTPYEGETYGKTYDWQVLKDAGFNTVWPWPIGNNSALLDLCAKYDFQAVLMHAISDEDLAKLKDHPNLLGNVWMDEPIGQFGEKMQGMFDNYETYKKHAKEIDPDLKVFINDAPWITEPATEWWIKWNVASDISCHDSYPIYNVENEQAKSVALGHNTPASMNLAVSSTNEEKPVWLIVGAFSQPCEYGTTYSFRFPTPNQLRCCAYTGIIHGATGIIFFAWDSFITREGQVIGMSPNPQRDMGNGDPKYVIAKPVDLANSLANWSMAKQINSELKELAPYILTPTLTDQFGIKVTGKGITKEPIHCMLKSDGEGGYILISTNVDGAFLKVNYTFEGFREAQTMFENQTPLKVEKGSFEISYEPFETHIFHITK